jgi:hypothetical protein
VLYKIISAHHGGQRLDAMKGCKALAKRAHACDYEKQHNNPS